MTKRKEEVKKEEEEKKEEPKVLEEVKQASSENKGGREARFKALLKAYKVQNPVKYAIKEKNGEFKKIPDSFV